jgi:hypothetical protein
LNRGGAEGFDSVILSEAKDPFEADSRGFHGFVRDHNATSAAVLVFLV